MMDYSSLFEAEQQEQAVLPKSRRKFRFVPVVVSVVLLPVLVLLGWFGFMLLRPRLEGLLRFVSQQAPPEQAAVPVAVATQTPIVTPTVVHPPTATQPSPTATEPAAFPDCYEWQSVSLDLLGEQICVHGEYLRHFRRDDATYVMVFSEDPGTFQVWSYPKPFDWYMQGSDSTCIVARGWVQTSGVRPVIILGSKGSMEACP